MIEIEEKNMVLGLFLRKTNLTYLFIFLVGCSTSLNFERSNGYQLNSLLKYFIQVDEISFNITTPYKIEGIENIELNHYEDFKIVSVTSSITGSEIKLSRKTKKIIQSLNVSFLDRTNTSRNIKINFYSKIINIDELELGQKVIFDRTTDTVPPLFVMSSLQTGEFIVCEDNDILLQFELLKGLYFFSIGADFGSYNVGEKTCQNTYFNLIVK